MDVSDQMWEAVANAKKQAKAAERQFDLAAEMVNIKSSSSIDLFGGRAVSQVADIASSVRKACDELTEAIKRQATEKILADSTDIKDIKAGKVGIKLRPYHQKKFNRDCFGQEFVDIN